MNGIGAPADGVDVARRWRRSWPAVVLSWSAWPWIRQMSRQSVCSDDGETSVRRQSLGQYVTGALKFSGCSTRAWV